MVNNETFIDYNSCDKDALISMHETAMDLYRHEDETALKNSGRFLVLSSAFLALIGILIIHTAGCLEDAYFSFMNDEYYSSTELSALFSLILLLIGLICFLNLLKSWEVTLKTDNDRKKTRLNAAVSIERVLCEKGFIDHTLCPALNEKKRTVSAEEALPSKEEDKKGKKKEKKKTKADMSDRLIRMYRITALFFAVATLALFAFLVYSFIGRMAF